MCFEIIYALMFTCLGDFRQLFSTFLIPVSNIDA